VQNGQEYRYVCRIGCGGVPMRVYNKAMSGGRWTSVEDYLRAPTVIAYTRLEGTFGHYVWLSGHGLADWTVGDVWMYYQDRFGVEVGTEFFPAGLLKPAPLYLGQDEGILGEPCTEGYIPVYATTLQQKDQKPKPKPSTPYSRCLEACRKMRDDQENECRKDHAACVEKCGGKPECVRNCDNALSDCIQRVSGRAVGCAQRCSQVHLGQTIEVTVDLPVKIPFLPDPIQVPLPTAPYDTWCQEQTNKGQDPRKKYPELPPPTQGWSTQT